MVFNNYFLLVQSFVAAFMLAGGFFSLLLYLGDRKIKTNLYLSVITFILVFYSISNIFLFTAPDIESFILAEKVANYIILSAVTPFLLFLREYSGYKPVKLFYILLFFFNSLFFVNYFSEYGIAFSAIHSIDRIQLPWGEFLTEVKVSISFTGYMVIVGVSFLLVYLIMALKHLYKTKREDVRVISIGLSVLLGSILIDYVISSLKLASFPYIQQFSYLIFLYFIGAKNFRNVIERKNLETELVSREIDYKVITAKAGDVIFKVDRNFVITFVSSVVTRYLDYLYKELLGKNFDLLVYQDDQSLFEKNVEERNDNLTCRMISKDGKVRWMSTSVSEITDSKGSVVSYILISRDITDQMLYTHEIDEKNRLLESIIQSSPYILYTFDLGEYSRIYSYSQIKRYLGYTRQEYDNLGRRPFEAIMHQDDLKELPNHIKRWNLAEDGEAIYTDFRLRHKNGKYKWFRGSDVVFKRDENGNVLEILGAAQEIDDHKNMLKELEENEKRLRALAEATFEGIVFSVDGIVIDANQQAIDMHGYEKHEFIGLQIGVGYPEKIRDQILSKINNEANSFYQTSSQKKDGTLFPVEIRAKTIILGGEKVRISVLRDITSQIEKENELLRAKEEAEKSDKLKSDFLTQISHEIRSPIHTILSFAGYIREQLTDKVDDDILESLDAMDTSGKRIIRTVDLILNMSQLNTGTFDVKKRFVPIIPEVINPIVKEYEILAKEKGNKFIMECGANASSFSAYVDEYAMKQIMQNLIDNAVKYTDNGIIKIGCDRLENKYSIYIEDNGIGIAEDYLPKLFSSFSQEEQGYTRRYDGNGLGLALVKKYCDINKIDINLKSKKGEGSRFTLTFNEEVKFGGIQE